MITRKMIKRSVDRKFNPKKSRNPYPTASKRQGGKRQANDNDKQSKKKTKRDTQSSQLIQLPNKLKEKTYDKNDVGLAMFSSRMLRHLPCRFEDGETPYDAVRNFFNLREFESYIIQEVSGLFLRVSRLWMNSSKTGKLLYKSVNNYRNDESLCKKELYRLLLDVPNLDSHCHRNFEAHFSRFFGLLIDKNDDDLRDLIIMFLFVFMRKKVLNEQNIDYFNTIYTIEYKFSKGLENATYSFENLSALCSILQFLVPDENARLAIKYLKDAVDTKESFIPKALRVIAGHYVHATNFQLYKLNSEIIRNLKKFNAQAQKIKDESLKFSEVTMDHFSQICLRIYPEAFLPKGVEIHIPSVGDHFSWQTYNMLFQNDAIAGIKQFDKTKFYQNSNSIPNNSNQQQFLSLIKAHQDLKQHYLSGFIQGFNANINRNPKKAIDVAKSPSDYSKNQWRPPGGQTKDKRFSTINSEDLKQIVEDNRQVMIFYAKNEEDDFFLSIKKDIKDIFYGLGRNIYFMTMSNISQAMPNRVYTVDEVNASTPYMVFIDSNQIISNMEMNEKNWGFLKSNDRIKNYFQTCIKFPVVKDHDDEKLLKLKIYLTYQMVFLGINSEMAHQELPVMINEQSGFFQRCNKLTNVLFKLLSYKDMRDLPSLDKTRVYSVKNQQDSRLKLQDHADEAVRAIIKFSEYMASVRENNQIKKGSIKERDAIEKQLSEIKQTNVSLISMWQRRELCINYHVTSPVISDQLAKQAMTAYRHLNKNYGSAEEVKQVFFHVGLLNGNEAFETEDDRFKQIDKRGELRRSNDNLLVRSPQKRRLFPRQVIQSPATPGSRNTYSSFPSPAGPQTPPNTTFSGRVARENSLVSPRTPHTPQPYRSTSVDFQWNPFKRQVSPKYELVSPRHPPTPLAPQKPENNSVRGIAKKQLFSPGNKKSPATSFKHNPSPLVKNIRSNQKYSGGSMAPESQSRTSNKRDMNRQNTNSVRRELFKKPQVGQNTPRSHYPKVERSRDMTLGDFLTPEKPRKNNKRGKKRTMNESTGVRRSSRKRKALGSSETIPIKKERLQQLDQKIQKYRRTIRKLHRQMENIH